MSAIRSGPYTLKDPDDDAAFQALKDDVLLLKRQLAVANSLRIGGIPLSDALPTDGQAVVYDGDSRIWKPGTISTAADLYGFSAYNGSAQTFSSATITTVVYTVNNFDTTDGDWDKSTGIFTIGANQGGYYLANTSIETGYLGTSYSTTMYIYKNGALVSDFPGSLFTETSATNQQHNVTSSISTVISAASGNTFQVKFRQSNNGSDPVDAYGYFSMIKLPVS